MSITAAHEFFVHDSRGPLTRRPSTNPALRRVRAGALTIDKVIALDVARKFGLSWGIVNAIAVEATDEVLLTAGSTSLDGVHVIGVGEHRWAHS